MSSDCFTSWSESPLIDWLIINQSINKSVHYSENHDLWKSLLNSWKVNNVLINCKSRFYMLDFKVSTQCSPFQKQKYQFVFNCACLQCSVLWRFCYFVISIFLIHCTWNLICKPAHDYFLLRVEGSFVFPKKMQIEKWQFLSES